ncbi:MAG: hypothetical protein AAF223_00160 [Bacteroidota bacterium]
MIVFPEWYLLLCKIALPLILIALYLQKRWVLRQHTHLLQEQARLLQLYRESQVRTRQLVREWTDELKPEAE